MTDPIIDITLSFGKARSVMYKKVIAQCETFHNFNTQDGTHTLQLTASEIFSKWQSFSFIFNTTQSWISFDLEINSRPVLDFNDKRKAYYSLQELRSCYKHYLERPDQHKHCTGSWGCNMLKSVEFNFDKYSTRYWYKHGEFKDGKWIIDKESIFFTLMNEAKGRYINHCPLFDEKEIHRKIQDLPDEIDVSSNNWQVHSKPVFIGGKIKHVPFAIDWIGDDDEFDPDDLLNGIKPLNSMEITGSGIDISELPEELQNRILDEMNKRNKG